MVVVLSHGFDLGEAFARLQKPEVVLHLAFFAATHQCVWVGWHLREMLTIGYISTANVRSGFFRHLNPCLSVCINDIAPQVRVDPCTRDNKAIIAATLDVVFPDAW